MNNNDLNKTPRILILYASVGYGHQSAAESIQKAFEIVNPGMSVELIDVLAYSHPIFSFCYRRGYLAMIRHFPRLLDYLYQSSDDGKNPWNSFQDSLRLSVEKICTRRFIQKICAGNWDAIIHTHFLPAEIIAALKKEERLKIPHFTVVTDFFPHRFWVHSPCEHYFVAIAESQNYLRHQDVPAMDMSVTGIPIAPKFSEPINKAEALKRFGLSGERPLILQLAGGVGTGPVKEIFTALLQTKIPLEIVSVTGNNPRVLAELQAVPIPERHRVKVLGFTDRIHDLMAIATLVVSKPGGLTVSEVLASETPLVIVHAVPGQESLNGEFLLEKGAAIKVNKIEMLPDKLMDLLKNPPALAQMKLNAARLARGRAAFEIVQKILANTNSQRRAANDYVLH